MVMREGNWVETTEFFNTTVKEQAYWLYMKPWVWETSSSTTWGSGSGVFDPSILMMLPSTHFRCTRIRNLLDPQLCSTGMFLSR